MLNFQTGKVAPQIVTATEPDTKIVGLSSLPERSNTAPLSQGFAAILARFFPEPNDALQNGSAWTEPQPGEKPMLDMAMPDRVEGDEATVTTLPSDADYMANAEMHMEHAGAPASNSDFVYLFTRNDPVTKGTSTTRLSAADRTVPVGRTQGSSLIANASDQPVAIFSGPVVASRTAEREDRPDVDTFSQAGSVDGVVARNIALSSVPQGGPELAHRTRSLETMTERDFQRTGADSYDAKWVDDRMMALDPAPPTLTDRYMQGPHQAHDGLPAPNDPPFSVSDQRGISERAQDPTTTLPSTRPDVPLDNAPARLSKQNLASLPKAPEMAPVPLDRPPGQNALLQDAVQSDIQPNVRTHDQPVMKMGASLLESAISHSMRVSSENRALDVVPRALQNAPGTGPARRADDIFRLPQRPEPEARNVLLRLVEPVPSVPEPGNAIGPRRLMANDVMTAAERPPQFDTTLPQRSIGRDTVAPINAAPVEADSLNRQQNPANMAGNGTRAPMAELPHSYGPAPRMDAPITSAAAPLMAVTQPRQASGPTQNPGAVALVPQSRTGEASIGQPVERGELDLVQRPDTVRFAAGQLLGEASALPRAGQPGQPTQADLSRHVAQQIVTALRTGGDMASELYLSPSELGRVRISLSSSDLGMVVSIIADRPETLDLMRRHADQLAQDFHDIGYHGAEFSFGQGASDQSQAERSQPGHLDQHERGARPDETNGSTPAAGVALDRLDLRV